MLSSSLGGMPTKKKESVASAPKAPVAKKSVVKKTPVAKQTPSSSPLKRGRTGHAPALKHQAVAPHFVPPVHGKTVTHHRVVLYETCTNCAHMPDRVGTLVGTLSILVALLSGMVLSLAPVPQNWQNLVASHYSSSNTEQVVAQK